MLIVLCIIPTEGLVQAGRRASGGVHVACLQCHPHLAVLATSGIESVVRLWAPSSDVPGAVHAAAAALEAVGRGGMEAVGRGAAASASEAAAAAPAVHGGMEAVDACVAWPGLAGEGWRC